MHLLLVFNPTAGRGRARRHVEEAVKLLQSAGARVDLTASASPDDLTRKAAEGSRAGYDAVVVCGGDGSLNLAIREFDVSRCAIGLLPLGSGNDFARVCGISSSLEAACAVITSGLTREVDVATGNGRRYLGVAGLGFDSEVARYANENVRYLRGSAVYLYAIMRVLPRFTPHRVRIDGAEQEIMFAAVGNSRQYGGGIRITPDALIDDGQLDACIVHRTSRLELLKTLPKAYTGAHVKSGYVEMRRAGGFTFESDRPLDVYADGEPITQTPVRFELATERLRIFAPRQLMS